MKGRELKKKKKSLRTITIWRVEFARSQYLAAGGDVLPCNKITLSTVCLYTK